MVYKISCSSDHDRRRGTDTKREKDEGSKMKKLGLATVAASALAAGVVGLAAPALAAPTGPGNAQQTINNLQGQGYTVIVNRLGTAPLDQASVVAIRPGQEYSQTDSATPGDSFQTRVLNKTVYVDVK